MSPKVTKTLKALGHDVLDTRQVAMQTANDDELWEFAQSEDRIFITFDLDFADIRNYPSGFGTGIIVFRTRSATSQTVMKYLQTLFDSYTEAELTGRLIIITESQIRLRK